VKTATIVIISTIHLLSENCQAKLLLDTLRECDYKILITNGELIEDNKVHTKWFRLTEIVTHDAFEFVRGEGIDVIICAHNYLGIKHVFNEGGQTIEYWNSVDSTDLECFFITIDEKGSLELHYFTNIPSNLNLNVNNSN
jgi:hypothetical protein